MRLSALTSDLAAIVARQSAVSAVRARDDSFPWDEASTVCMRVVIHERKSYHCCRSTNAKNPVKDPSTTKAKATTAIPSQYAAAREIVGQCGWRELSLAHLPE